MKKKKENGINFKSNAQMMMEMINIMSLFTRKTVLSWMPELMESLGVNEERFMVLFELNLEPGVSLKSLSQSLMVSSPSLSIMINSMVDQGLVSRTQDPEDRRKVLLCLGPQGKKCLAKSEEYLSNQFEQYLLSLPLNDREELIKFSSNLMNVVKKILA